MNSKKTTHNP